MQSAGNWNQKASAFDVIYVPEKSGLYEIRVFCGNIPLNGGHTFRKEVSPGNSPWHMNNMYPTTIVLFGRVDYGVLVHCLDLKGS